MIYVLLCVISALATFWLSLFSWRRRHSPGITSFSLMTAGMGTWLVNITLMLVSPTAGAALFWYRLSYLPLSFSTVLLLLFVAGYTGMALANFRGRWLLFAVPALNQFAVWTDDTLHLFFTSLDIVSKNGLMVVGHWSAGPGFIIHCVYCFSALFLGLGILFVHSVRQFRMYRSQSMAFIVGSLSIILPNLAYAMGLIPPDAIIAPVIFLPMALCFTWGIFRHKMLEIVPVARQKIVDVMSDGMLVLDAENRIRDVNTAAKTILGLRVDDIVGHPVDTVFAQWPRVVAKLRQKHLPQAEVSLNTSDGKLYFDVRTTELFDKAQHKAGRLILFRDITEYKTMEHDKDKLLIDLNTKNQELERLYSMALDANPMTGMPGNNSIRAAISKAIELGEDVCVIYTDLDNFKAYNDAYGFAKGDDIIRFTADVLQRSMSDAGCEKSFAGHIGGDDFVLLVPSDKYRDVVDLIIADFDGNVGGFYHPADRHNGFISSVNRRGIREEFPIITISMAGVDMAHSRYGEYYEVNDACAALKKIAKDMTGSSFALDQRQASSHPA